MVVLIAISSQIMFNQLGIWTGVPYMFFLHLEGPIKLTDAPEAVLFSTPNCKKIKIKNQAGRKIISSNWLPTRQNQFNKYFVAIY
jgi:hypothetical protein